jgi:hypothetical protein
MEIHLSSLMPLFNWSLVVLLIGLDSIIIIFILPFGYKELGDLVAFKNLQQLHVEF